MNDFGEGEQDTFPGGFPTTTVSTVDVETHVTASDNATKPHEQSNGAATATEQEGTEKTGSSVYIANLQWWTTDADVERLCSTYGTVVNINFLAERSNGKSKGVALVEFSDGQAASRCKEGLSGCNIHGRNCVVTFPNQSYQRGYGGSSGRYSQGYYDRGRMGEGRGRGRHGRGYGHGGYDNRQAVGMPMMGDMPGYMHEMGMMDGPPDVMPHMEGHVTQHGGPGYVPPPPYPVMGGGGYMHDEHYDQNPYYRRGGGGERWDSGVEPEDIAVKRQRPGS